MDDLDWPKGYAIPQNIKISIYTERNYLGRVLTVKGWAEHQSVGGEQLDCASFVSLGFYDSLICFFIVSVIRIIVIIFYLNY